MVTDEEILAAYKLLAQEEGVFVEPASAASVAGLMKIAQDGFFADHQGARVVCTLTGHGLKDPNIAIKNIDQPVTLDASVSAVLQEIGL